MKEINQKKERNRILSSISIVFLFALIGYIFLIPYQYFSAPKVKILNFYICPIKYLPIVLIFFLFFITLINSNLRNVVNKYKYFNFLIVLFLLIGFLSSFSAVNITLSFTRLFYYTASGIIIAYFCIVNINNISTIKLFTRFVIVLGLIISVYGMVEFISGKNIIFANIFDNSNYLYQKLMRGHNPLSGGNRIISTIGHPVVLAFILIPPITFTFMEYSCTNVFREKVFFLICSLLLFVGLFLTFSRGSWIAILVTFIVYFWRKKKSVLSFILPMILVFVIIISLSGSVRSTLISRNPEAYLKNPEITNRIMSYLTAAKIFSDYPLFGIGIANFRLIRWDYDEFSTSVEAPDNMFLMTLAERGILGLGILIIFLFYILKNLRRAVKNSKNDISRELAWALFCIFIAFIVNMLTFDVLYQPVPRIIFWTLTGFAVRISNE